MRDVDDTHAHAVERSSKSQGGDSGPGFTVVALNDSDAGREAVEVFKRHALPPPAPGVYGVNFQPGSDPRRHTCWVAVVASNPVGYLTVRDDVARMLPPPDLCGVLEEAAWGEKWLFGGES